MGYDGISMNTTVMAGYTPPPGFGEVNGGTNMQCAMAEMVALAQVDAKVTPAFQKFARDANAGFQAYKNQVTGSVRDYYQTDVNGGMHFDGITPQG
ncbi:hypothetical protein [Actinophytocola sp. KF-1]|jgi:hypothetical protein